MFRLYIERKPDFCNEANRIYSEITGFLGMKSISAVRYLNRYDIENVSDEICRKAADRIFSEPQSDVCYFSHFPMEKNETVIAWELLPGQYDQRADSAEQCLTLLMTNSGTSEKPRVRCARLVVLQGNPSVDEIEKIKNYLINPVDSRLAEPGMPETLEMKTTRPDDIPVQTGFNQYNDDKLADYLKSKGLAMDLDDLKFLQSYFKSINRDPTETEIKVLDTYWSDHCRHTTFTTCLESIDIEEGPYKALFEEAMKNYSDMRTELYTTKEKPVTLMDMAVIGAKYLKKHGKLDDIELSEEINACSVFIDVHCQTTTSDGKKTDSVEKWLLMFKNETHNHPTEIEPFGGAATCIGGAIRDPLSGRAWVYQAMRITGAGVPTKLLSDTKQGKLPQLKLTREAAAGFSSYGNQIGLTTGLVHEVYHEGFEAKRMELGAVIAASPAENVKREVPEPGDIVILVGGGTGRDGIGGATGSSKVHTVESVTTAAAEVQKGNAVEERKIQRLFRNAEVASMIRRCNDFGAGGVAVAVGELSPGLDINLDNVPKKYEGLNGTELAISESQERMAVVVRASDVDAFIKASEKENLSACVIATVTDTDKLVMHWRGKTIVDIDRSFLDTAGASKKTKALISSPKEGENPLVKPLNSVDAVFNAFETYEKKSKTVLFERALETNLSDLSCCSQRGLCERFDGSIGSATVLFPFGGAYQGTPEVGMAAKIPVFNSADKDSVKETSTVSLMSYGYDAYVSSWSPYHGAQIAVLDSLAKIAALGGNPEKARLTFQEYFERTVNSVSWGKPAAALLGALDAQKKMGTASIGGKDSMSGTYQSIHVPPTLVSFAVNVAEADEITSGAFKSVGSCVYLLPQVYTKDLTPDFENLKKHAVVLKDLKDKKLLNSVYTVSAGGVVEAVAKMSFGNHIGFEFAENAPSLVTEVAEKLNGFNSKPDVDFNLKALFIPMYGSFVLETSAPLDNADSLGLILIGHTSIHSEITIDGMRCGLGKTIELWEKPLKDVFPPVSASPAASVFSANEKDILSGTESADESLPSFAREVHSSRKMKPAQIHIGSCARPKVILPVFPGTNCELDMERAFRLAGAETELLVFRNKTAAQLQESLALFKEKLSTAQILALSGGFSVGDEPDGSGKFIANVLREHAIADEVMSLLEDRKGLVLGICNGFQALIKVGLVPYGKIMEPDESCPTLTYNRVNRHISRVVRTRVVSSQSPWARHESIYNSDIHMIPISHGEGRIVMDGNLAEKLFAAGQVFTLYVDDKGCPTLNEPDNPNGSAFAIEGLTSPNGLVLGKMGHNERTLGTGMNGSSDSLLKNIEGNKCQNIFAAGVSYFN